MKLINIWTFVTAIILLPINSYAANQSISNLTISKIRAVGNYAGTTYDDTIEIWFTTPLSWSSGSKCTNTYRVMVDVKYSHIISAAYMALASSKKVSVNIDDTLPIRAGACEVSYIDVGS
jgi:hypothetical protein